MYAHYREQGRVFPWRETRDPWAILVSEIMLQQTQTDRVLPYWKRWMQKWPTPEALASASLEEVLREWSGLGYNRRARFLKAAAEKICSGYGGRLPSSIPELLKLPGIGTYTAHAVACFAFDSTEAFIETNIRSAAIHYFFQDTPRVSDAEIMPILRSAMDLEKPAVWHWALMDYGAALKKITKNPSRKSSTYTKQSRFEGSMRQARGALLRLLSLEGPSNLENLCLTTKIEKERLERALKALGSEGFVAEESGIYRIST